MKNIILISLLFISSCSSIIKTVGTRMISPEAHGGLGKGSMEARLETAKRDKLDFKDESTDNSVDRYDTRIVLTGMVDIGFFERLDFFVLPSLTYSPFIWGAKYQFIGSPKSLAQKGNFSSSLTLGYGKNGRTNTSSDAADYFKGDDLEKVEVRTEHFETGIISGYRWGQSFLHYVNVIYLRENVNGFVTNDSGTLNKAKFKYSQDGIIYSTGFIHYFAKAHWKFDYSHFVSDWTRTQRQTVNTINAAIGFNW